MKLKDRLSIRHTYMADEYYYIADGPDYTDF